MHLSESVPQDLMCLRSRCVAVRWIQPSDLYVTIEDCSSPSAEPPVPATVHWRQRAAFTSRTRDRQSSYNPQLCCVRAHSKVVRRSLGDHSSTRAQTRGACSPASPGKDTAIFSEICGIILTTLPSRHPTRPAAAILGHECNICAALAIRRVCSAPRRRGSPSRTNTLRPGGARRDPRCESVGGARVPALSGTAAGAERAQIRPPRVKEGGSDTAKRCFRGPHELAFVRAKIFIYPQFASSALCRGMLHGNHFKDQALFSTNGRNSQRDTPRKRQRLQIL